MVYARPLSLRSLWLTVLASTWLRSSWATSHPPIALHPENPRFFLFRGKARALLTSTEHFGAAINLDFDYKTYLQALAANGFSLTQTWTGSYVEPDSDVGPFNTLDPKPDKYIAPWARTQVPGNKKGGTKFDLARFNSTFFDRLRDFVDTASGLGIIVELGLFGGYEQENPTIWEFSPLNPENNVNGLLGVNRTNAYSLDAPEEFTALQVKTVREIAKALRGFDNHYFQVISVANLSTPEWGERIAEAVHSEDPRRLLAAPTGGVWPRMRGIDIVNLGAYTSPQDVKKLYQRQQPLVFDETGAYDSPSRSRQSFWQFMLSGGSAIDNLDWSYCQGGYENGTLPADKQHQAGQGGPVVRKYLRILDTFFNSLDFLHMVPDVSWLTVPGTAAAGQVGLVDINRHEWAGYVAEPGVEAITLELGDPAIKRCTATFLDTQRGNSSKFTLHHSGGHASIRVPPYAEDFAVLVRCEASQNTTTFHI